MLVRIKEANIKSWRCPHCSAENRHTGTGGATLLSPRQWKWLAGSLVLVGVLIVLVLVQAWRAGAPYHDTAANRNAFFAAVESDPALASADESTLQSLSKSVCTLKASGKSADAINAQLQLDAPALPGSSLRLLVDESLANFCPNS